MTRWTTIDGFGCEIDGRKMNSKAEIDETIKEKRGINEEEK